MCCAANVPPVTAKRSRRHFFRATFPFAASKNSTVRCVSTRARGEKPHSIAFFTPYFNKILSFIGFFSICPCVRLARSL
jgi:hypothetical protein